MLCLEEGQTLCHSPLCYCQNLLMEAGEILGKNNCDSLFVDQRVLTFQGQLIFREVLTSLAIDIVGGRTTEPFDQ